MDKDYLTFAFAFITIIFMIFILCGAMAFFNYHSTKTMCERYNGYGYYTEFEGHWYGHFECLIYLEDGSKIPLHDFKTMQIKEPMLRGS